MTCNRPPKGWYCTREKDHNGPCAAIPKNDWDYCESLRSKIQRFSDRIDALTLQLQQAKEEIRILKESKKLDMEDYW